MRTIGLIGGMSWESSALYYRIVNETVKEKLGGHHSAVGSPESTVWRSSCPARRSGDWSTA